MSSQENELYNPPFDWEHFFWVMNSPENWAVVIALVVVWLWKKWDEHKKK